MEITCAESLKKELSSKQISAGETVSIEHTAMATQGEDVQIRTTLKKREKRKVVFTFEAFCKEKIIAKGYHKRVIIPVKLLSRML